MGTDPTFFKDTVAVTARESEVPAASFTNGLNAGASNAAGVGIDIAGGAVSGDPTGCTLLDQDEAARVPQGSQQLGTAVRPILTATNQTQAAKDADSALDGEPVITGDAHLQTVGAGWVDTAV